MIVFFTDFLDQINSIEVNITNAIFRLILSMLLGVIVGAERKRKGQMAGIRTFALISMGSCLAMLLSIYVPQVYMGLKNGDPGRIAAQVITGIGFIGGGAMIHMKGSVRGLTTAAGIWMTAIIGMTVGVGMYLCSFAATLLILLTLVAIGRYEKRRRLGQEAKVIGLTIKGILKDITPYSKLLAENDAHLSTYYLNYNYEKQTTELNLIVLVHAYTDLLPVLEKISHVEPTESLTLSSQLDI